MQPRHWIMLLSLAVTLVLVFSLEEEDDTVLEPMPAKRSAQAAHDPSGNVRSENSRSENANTSVASINLANSTAGNASAATAVSNASKSSSYLAWGLLEGRATPAASADGASADLFRSQHWYVPPAKTAAELAPPPPVIPEPGFAYMGKLEEGPQGTVILLASANRLYSVSVGERIDPNWRLDHEDEQSLGLTYLPLNLPKTLLKKSKVTVPINPASHLQGDQDDLQGNL